MFFVHNAKLKGTFLPFPAEECIATLNGTGLFHKPTFSSEDSTKTLSSAICRAGIHHRHDKVSKISSIGRQAYLIIQPFRFADIDLPAIISFVQTGCSRFRRQRCPVVVVYQILVYNVANIAHIHMQALLFGYVIAFLYNIFQKPDADIHPRLETEVTIPVCHERNKRSKPAYSGTSPIPDDTKISQKTAGRCGLPLPVS